MFALIDCNNFYASCERIFRPELNGKPIVVLSNNDGCIIARSNEAKALGIPMGAPLFQYENVIRENNVYVFSANFELYGDISNRVMSILSDFCPEIEIYSIDEAFLDLSQYKNFNLRNFAEEVKKRVLKWVGVPIGIGIAPTKSLAKVANHIAKKFPEYTKNIHIIDSEEKKLKALKWLPVEDVWGIGPNYAELLNRVNVRKAYDFIQLPDQWIKKHMKINGLLLKYDLSGIKMMSLETPTMRKNIATTRSFETYYEKFDDLKERITTFASQCAFKLRQQKSHCKSLSVFVATNRFSTNSDKYFASIHLQLPYSTNSTIDIVKYAIIGLKKIFKEGYQYKKAGVICHEVYPESFYQPTFFENRNEKHLLLMKTLDKINHTYGNNTIRLASQDEKGLNKMKRNFLSPCYTTRIEDIITIKV
ncbi:MAG: SOS mutagenesis and repair protein UmuC [Bacteroidia bacterium]|nr:MAG: SOS mutagenesis and repair protein UmuC [Bacteroidia bacterium]